MPRADFELVVGLEVHAQLLTASKLFSRASTVFGQAPNTQTTEVCLAMPGSLPVPNARVVELAIRTGLALGCTINLRSEWSRKHYFYPDLPKGYQITQYEFPICEWGAVAVAAAGGEKPVRIRRIHIEEDAGKSVHDAADGLTLIDLNRAGTPLLEIVSEPDLASAEEAVEYLKALREVLVYLGVNDGNLEEGSFRCDANVSVRRPGAPLGTRCELKNLNSFRFIKEAIEVEARRHVELIEAGGAVEQESRLFDPGRHETRSMRSKEDAHDYRYFPEPDLPPLLVAPELVERLKGELPELPRARRRRYVEVLRLPEYDAGVLTAEPAISDLFDRCVAEVGDAKQVSNWFMGELLRLLKVSGSTAAQVRFTPGQLKALLAELDAGRLSNAGAKVVFEAMFETGAEPAAIIAERGLGATADEGALEAAVDAALAASPKNVEGYRAGNGKLLGFFVGQVMKALKGQGNPKRINELLVKKLGG
jgi:aspartyl-tRNA(Asn)/glutamyl-tRNA(Gln) amidotransferase subunit B